MSENVGRKKSHRWVSASRAAYDGSGWNSDDSSDDGLDRDAKEEVHELPNLPREINTSELETSPDLRSSLPTTGGTPSPRSSLDRRRTTSPEQVSRNLDSLMNQISREMTPQSTNNARFPSNDESLTPHQFSHASKRISSYVDGSLGESDSEDDDQQESGSDEEFKVSKTGYFANYLKAEEPGDEGDIQKLQLGSSALAPEYHVFGESADASATRNSISSQGSVMRRFENSKSSPDKEASSVSSATSGDKSVRMEPEAEELREATVPRPTEAPTQQPPQEDYDNESLFNQYERHSALSSPSEKSEFRNSDVDSPLRSSRAQASSEISLNSGSGSSGQYAKPGSDLKGQNEDEPFKFKARDRQSMLDSSGDEHDFGPSSCSDSSKNTETFKEDNDSTFMEKNDRRSGDDSDDNFEDETSTESDDNSITKTIHEGALTPTVDVYANFSANADKASVGSGQEQSSEPALNRQSIKLDKWQPDIDSHRTAFLQDSTPKPPQGFVIDENGEMVNLTPSSMRNNVSTVDQGELESHWEAFPSTDEQNGDLQTITDTKTIYDNQTAFNVPGILTTGDNLPPLPDVSVSDSDKSKTITSSDSILKKLEGNKNRHDSNFKESFSGREPKTAEIAQLNGQPVPELNVNSIISAKSSTHKAKITKLKDYSGSLEEYDSGLQSWINYALKTSTSDKDFIFHDYSVNSHVRDAYAHADELSKRVTVSSTVANVNQNVSHLKRKVFSHTMKEKSKGLFSSIGKKL
ncbi:LAMI_0A07866g1_1 [Lachancea mirantina]|uniref:LAMI_0A07866g1_1 n=1 Tax=Lachancea mirantina TaxID=1230905 RepID=A0A1G4IQZ5_9SACH|nr:LAMI_0A07866g1_1 [Lachancea mirantina]